MKIRKKDKKLILILLTVICCVCGSNLIISQNKNSISAAEKWLWPAKGYTGLSRGYTSDHKGIDITGSNIYGTVVRAAKSGTVTSASNSCGHYNTGNNRCSCNGGRGNYVEITHADGTKSRYLHMIQGSAIATGTKVSRGQKIGLVGSSGDSSGPHLHFDIWVNGNRINNNPAVISYDYGESAPQMSGAGISIPSTLTRGSNYGIRGTVNANGQITWLWVGVKRRGTNDHVIKTECNPMRNSYDISSMAAKLNFASLAEGNYTFTVEGITGGKYFTVYKKDFTVVKPLNSPVLKVSRAKVAVGQTATLSWNKVPDATSYIIDGFCNGKEILWKNVGNVSSYDIKTTTASEYIYYVIAINGNNKGTSNGVKLIVDDYMEVQGVHIPYIIQKGTKYSLSGTAQANNQMTWIWMGVKRRGTNDHVIKSEYNPMTKTYDLQKIAQKLDFSTLSAGDYTFTIEGISNNKYYTMYKQDFSVKNKISFNLQGGNIKGKKASYSVNGFNRSRGEKELILYSISGSTVDTNYYGTEVSVDSNGKIQQKRGWGNDDKLKVYQNGFVLSGHLYDNGGGFLFTNGLSCGEYVYYNYQTNQAEAYGSQNEYLYAEKFVGKSEKYGLLPVPSKAGYVFDGWYTQSTGGKRISEGSVYTTSNLYAHWSKPKPTQKFVSSIKITGISSQIAAGKNVKLTANVAPSNATNKSVTWKSSNTKIVTVKSDGTITTNKNAKGKTTTVTATAKDGTLKKATYKITVMKGEVRAISLSGAKTIKTGTTLYLKAKVNATSGANKKLRWSSSNAKYATVSSAGKVTALKAGKNKSVKITALATDGSGKKNTVTIKIK